MNKFIYHVLLSLLLTTIDSSETQSSHDRDLLLNFNIYRQCTVCREGSTLVDPNATVPSLKIPCWKADLGGKLGFIADCDSLRRSCPCESPVGGMNSSNTSWSDLVGVSGEVAKNVIRKQMPDIEIEIVIWGSFVSMEYRADRVRIFVDEETGEVKETPKIG
jgi:Potato inhibitor I family